jgi:hypothetical protein
MTDIEHVSWETLVPREKKWKDLFGKEIHLEDTVLNVWANNDLYRDKGQGGEGAIQYRVAKVIKINPKSIRIEYSHEGELRDCNIYNTANRIIVMNDDGSISSEKNVNAIIRAKTEKHNRIKKKYVNIKKKLEQSESKIGKLTKKIDDLQTIIDDFEKDYERFTILDL